MNIIERTKAAAKILVGKSTGRQSTEVINLLRFLGVDPDKEGSALSEATYYACLKVLGEAIGKLPLQILKYNEKQGVRKAREHPLYTMINSRPNPYMTASTFWSTMEYNRNHYGNAFALIDGAGENTKLWILPSDQVEIWYDDARMLADVPDVYYLYSGASQYFRFGSEEIIHLKSSNTFDGIEGIAVKDQLAATIRGGVKAQRLVNSMYDSGFTAKAVLNYTGSLNDANVQELVKLTEAYGKGQLKDKGIENIIPIPVGFSLNPLNIKLADNQFVEVKQYSAMQIAAAFGIKPYQIGDYTKSSYASAEAQQLSFYVDTLLYIIKQYEEEIGYKLLSDQELREGYHVKFNIAAILRTNMVEQINALSQAVNSFIYTPNEAREFLDKESIDGGDQLLGNGSSIPVQYTGAQYVTLEPQEISQEQTPEEPKEEQDPQDVNPDEVVSIIEAIHAGTITYEQAMAIVTLVMGFTEATASEMLGSPDDYTTGEESPPEEPTEATDGEAENSEQEESEEGQEEAQEEENADDEEAIEGDEINEEDSTETENTKEEEERG